MTREEVYYGIKEVLENKYEIDPNKIKEKAKIIEEIGIVSLEFMNLILDIEKKFDIVYNFEVDISTIEDLMDYILSKKDI